MNSITKLLEGISDQRLKVIITELYDLQCTGTLADGEVRKVAKELTAVCNIDYSTSLIITEKNIPLIAAKRWMHLI